MYIIIFVRISSFLPLHFGRTKRTDYVRRWYLWGHIYVPIWCVFIFRKNTFGSANTSSILEWAQHTLTHRQRRGLSAVQFIGIGFLFRNSLCVLSSSSVWWVLESILFCLSSLLPPPSPMIAFMWHSHLLCIPTYMYLAHLNFSPRLSESTSGSCCCRCWCDRVESLMTKKKIKIKSSNAQRRKTNRTTYEWNGNRQSSIEWTQWIMRIIFSFFLGWCISFSCLCFESTPLRYELPSV